LKRISGSTRSTRRLVVILDSPSGRHTLDIPEDARVDDLVPSLVEVCEGGSVNPDQWSLAPVGEPPLAGDRTVAESGLFPGAVLSLVPPAGQEVEEAAPGALTALDVARRLRARLRPSDSQTPETQRMGAAAYRRLLDGAIAAPRLDASVVVAVISTHGGAGTTTVAVLLTTLLASLRTDEVAVVDACPQSGALSHWMVPESGLSAETYRALFDRASTPDEIQGALVKAGRGLAVLPAPSNLHDRSVEDESDWGRLIEHLRHLHNVVIIDCGAGFQRPSGRAALAAADHVVLVSKAAPGDPARLGSMIESIRSQGKTVTVVSNHATRRARAGRSATGVPEISLAHEPQPAQRLKTRGFSWAEAPSSWQQSMRELAAVLIGRGGPTLS
jgi:MinD-like ATPase involved in chromosome partitioning or flagellar assembly